ncbi:MAG: hypothetical protein M0Z55_10770 [Peptococcaceae bacterium]|nr:hypothetical protein [Peptococcaceae bacterium]
MMKKSAATPPKNEVLLETINNEPLVTERAEEATLVASETLDMELPAAPESEEIMPNLDMIEAIEEVPETLDLKTVAQRISQLEAKVAELSAELATLKQKKNKKGIKEKRVKCKCRGKKVALSKCKCKLKKLAKANAKNKGKEQKEILV